MRMFIFLTMYVCIPVARVVCRYSCHVCIWRLCMHACARHFLLGHKDVSVCIISIYKKTSPFSHSLTHSLSLSLNTTHTHSICLCHVADVSSWHVSTTGVLLSSTKHARTYRQLLDLCVQRGLGGVVFRDHRAILRIACGC